MIRAERVGILPGEELDVMRLPPSSRALFRRTEIRCDDRRNSCKVWHVDAPQPSFLKGSEATDYLAALSSFSAP